MAYNKNLYSSDTDALDAGIIYDQNELMMQDEINAAIKNGDLIVGQADNLASKMNQFSTGEFIVRTTGGDASLSDGDGHLVLIRGNMIHTGYIAKSVSMTVTPIERDPSAGELTATIDNDVFLAEMESTSGTMVFTYGSNGWDNDPSDYGITVIGLALPGDEISVTYQKEVRGTIIQSNPSSFYSTGWNLYDHDLLRAKVVHYSDTYGFGIEGTYTQLLFSETLEGETEPITVTNGRFTIPSDGYVFVIGGNDTDTAIWMTWSDWQTEPNGGVWQAYSESEIDLSTIMATYFVNGLMAVGSYQDEIDLSLGKVTANVGKMTYSDENLDDVIAMGVEYDYDDSYIYYGLTEPIVSQISIENLFAASDHGIEYYTVTQVPIYTQTLYGVNLKNRLERDVVVKSEDNTISGNLIIENKGLYIKNTTYATQDVPGSSSFRYVYFRDKNDKNIGYFGSNISRNGFSGMVLSAGRQVEDSSSSTGYTQKELTLGLYVDSSGNRTIDINQPVTLSRGLIVPALSSVTKGDGYGIKESQYGIPAGEGKPAVLPSATATRLIACGFDKYDTAIAYLRSQINAAGSTAVNIAARYLQDGTTATSNYITLTCRKNTETVDGVSQVVDYSTVALSHPQQWRKALELSSTGAFPIGIAQGGTGATTKIGAINNLGGRTAMEGSFASTNTLTVTMSGFVTFRLSFLGGAANNNGEYLVYCGDASSVPVVTTVKAASNITITPAVAKLTIKTSSGTVYYGLITIYSTTAARLTITKT